MNKSIFSRVALSALAVTALMTGCADDDRTTDQPTVTVEQTVEESTPGGDTSDKMTDEPTDGGMSPEPTEEPTDGGMSPQPTATQSKGTSTSGALTAETSRYFKSLCGGIGNATSQLQRPTAKDAEGVKRQTAAAYAKLGSNFSSLASQLKGMPVNPSFEGEEAFKTKADAVIGKVGELYSKAEGTIKNGTFSTPTQLKSAIDKIEAEVTQANSSMFGLKDLDPEVLQQVGAEVPECSALGKQ